MSSDARKAVYFTTESIRSIQSKINEYSEPDFATARNFYLSAPAAYLGNRVTSYGTTISYRIRAQAGSDALPIGDDLCDLILQSRTTALCYKLRDQTYTSDVPRQVQVALFADDSEESAGSWSVIENLEQSDNELAYGSASKSMLMSVLVNVERLLVRAAMFEEQSAL